jgi:hypothetical protein
VEVLEAVEAAEEEAVQFEGALEVVVVAQQVLPGWDEVELQEPDEAVGL